MRHPRRLGAFGLVLAVLGGSLALAACAPDKATCTNGSKTVTNISGTSVGFPDTHTITTNNRLLDGRGTSPNFADDHLSNNTLTAPYTTGGFEVHLDNGSTPVTGACVLGTKVTTGITPGAEVAIGVLVDAPNDRPTTDLVIGDIQVAPEANAQSALWVVNADGVAVEDNYFRGNSYGIHVWGTGVDARFDDNVSWATDSNNCGPIIYAGNNRNNVSPRSNPVTQISNNAFRYDGQCASLTENRTSSSAAPLQPFTFTGNLVYMSATVGNVTSGTQVAGFPTPADLGLTTTSCKDNTLASGTTTIPTSVKNAWNAVCANTTFIDPAGAASAWNARVSTWIGAHGTL